MHTCNWSLKLLSCKKSSQGCYILKKYLRFSIELSSHEIIFLMNFSRKKMQSESEKSTFDTIGFWHNKTLKLKVYSKGFELKENCNLFAQCALGKDKRNIDMRTVLESRGGVGKSGVVDKVLKFANTKLLTRVPLDFFVCYNFFICHSNKQPKHIRKVKGLRVYFIYATRAILTT